MFVPVGAGDGDVIRSRSFLSEELSRQSFDIDEPSRPSRPGGTTMECFGERRSASGLAGTDLVLLRLGQHFLARDDGGDGWDAGD